MRPPERACVIGALLLAGLPACGGRSAIARGDSQNAEVGAPAELCDGLDQDSDGRVDEDFRDDDGYYVARAHCGSCGHACERSANATAVECALIKGVPTCAARSCAKGFGRSQSGTCVPLNDHLCLACRDDGDCGTLADARCIGIGGEPRCVRACGDGCPSGYVCVERDHCEPEGGSCDCTQAQPEFSVACSLPAASAQCVGSAQCAGGMLGKCRFPVERCDGIDNDCDDNVDEGFVDALSAYSLDVHNCGACGVDCTADSDAGLELACGGDPFAPSCVSACPDSEDGAQVGDKRDADRRLSNGCECKIVALVDASGKSASGQLDADCDGADGNVLESFYVSVAGDDSGPGSPTRPLRSIGAAIERAATSLTTQSARPHVYVASGVYTESVRMRDGVLLHGGYRSDFLAQSPSGFEVVVVAPSDTTAFGGAALTARGVGKRSTLIEGFSFRGRDALAPGEPAVGIELREPGAKLTVRDVRVRSGKPGAGIAGAAGASGAGPNRTAGEGQPPRAAIEDTAHTCIAGDANRAHGGAAGASMCGDTDASGGAGASSGCPVFGAAEAGGEDGRGASSNAGGLGGRGGRDLKGPILDSPACAEPVCCGLADFGVPSGFVLPGAGHVGADGASGGAGAACDDPIGSIDADDRWLAASAAHGGAGAPAAGGGGGGAGGGVQMTFVDVACEFADGLGGAGGGGGGGGCGGKGGRAGSSGGPAIGVLIRATRAEALPVFEDVEIIPHDGGKGGDGGAGGDGGQGGSGGFGGEVPAELRSTPPLAGPIAGQRGGKGGDGGAGGGGGGGCGGSSIGIWIHGLGEQPELGVPFQDRNAFALGDGGAAGRGGGGAMPAASGAVGRSIDVWVR